jgi:gluconolactonase
MTTPRDPTPRLERLATGFQFTEGPVWSATDRTLLFSDIPADRIYRWSPATGVTSHLHPSGHANGLTLDGQGRLVVCTQGTRRLARVEADGRRTVLAERYRGQRFNSPNDVVVKSDGAVYFTDPPYGIAPTEQDLPFQGVFRYAPESGAVRLLVDDFERPNGLAFSPDEQRLYIADSRRRHIRVFAVEPDGGVRDGRVFAEIRSERPGNPDGMKVDAAGQLYVAAAGGIWVFASDGTRRDVIETP